MIKKEYDNFLPTYDLAERLGREVEGMYKEIDDLRDVIENEVKTQHNTIFTFAILKIISFDFIVCVFVCTSGIEINFFVHLPLMLIDFKFISHAIFFTSHFYKVLLYKRLAALLKGYLPGCEIIRILNRQKMISK